MLNVVNILELYLLIIVSQVSKGKHAATIYLIIFQVISP